MYRIIELNDIYLFLSVTIMAFKKLKKKKNYETFRNNYIIQ